MMASTRDQLDELSGRIKEISKLIGSRQQARRHLLGRPRVRTGADAWPYVLHVALVVWVLRRDPVLASQLVAQFERKQAIATWSAQSIESQGEALSTETRELLINPLSARGLRALRDARKFLAESSLYSWVRAQNKNKGLAPSNGALWMQWSGQDANSDIAARAKTRRSRSQWLGRWGRRWSVMRGRFKQGDRLPLETLRAKARNLTLPAPQKVTPRPHFWDQNGAQFPGAKRGPLLYFSSKVVPGKWARFLAQVLAPWAFLGETIDTFLRPLQPGNGTTSWRSRRPMDKWWCTSIWTRLA